MKATVEALKNIAQGAVGSATGSGIFEILKHILKLI